MVLFHIISLIWNAFAISFAISIVEGSVFRALTFVSSMTVAICYKCGAMKYGAFSSCEKCGAQPHCSDDKALSMAISDQYFDKPALQSIAAAIQAGRPVPIDPAFISELKSIWGSPTGQSIEALFQKATGGSPSQSQPKPFLNNSEQIAKRLVSIEASRPGLVRMRANPVMIPTAVKVIKQLGFHKGLFKSEQQFIYDSVLENVTAMARLLPSSMLAGPVNTEGFIQCWSGKGPYVGEQGVFQLSNFSSGGKDKVVLIIKIDTFFKEIADLLGAITL